MVRGEERNQIGAYLFGYQSEKKEVKSRYEPNRRPNFASSSRADKERSYERELWPKDIVQDEEVPYENEKECTEAEPKVKANILPQVLEIPICHPLGDQDKMHTIKLSNIVGIDPRPFDPCTYVKHDFFATDKSGFKRCIPSQNIIRWRNVKNPDGTTSVESNARFVRWSDESLQLHIGEEVFDVSEEDANDIQTHLFLRHGKGIFQSQGRILKRMQFMPSSLNSDTHRTLCALVDARHKKVNKVKQCIAEIDPEREMELKERVERQIIRANKLLNRKRERVVRKYTQIEGKDPQLSVAFLEDANDEGPKHPHKLALPAAGSSQRAMPLSKKEKPKYKSKGKESEGPSSKRRSEGDTTALQGRKA